MTPAPRRLALSTLATACGVAAAHTPLPGLPDDVRDAFMGGSLPEAGLTSGALPALFAALWAVEAFAAAVPGLRSERAEAGPGRARLTLWAHTLASALAALDLARGGLPLTWVATRGVAVFGVLRLTQFAAERGAFHPVSALVLLALAPPLSGDTLSAVGASTLALGAVAWLMHSAPLDGRRRGTAWVPLPTSSLLPACAALALPFVLDQVGVRVALAFTSPWTLGVAAALLAWVTARGGARALSGPNADLFTPARTLSAVLVGALTALEAARAAHDPVSPLGVVVLVSVVADCVAELRFWTTCPDAVALTRLEDVGRLPALQDALFAARVKCLVRCRRERSLWHAFGPHLPMEVYVPADRAEDARVLLERAGFTTFGERADFTAFGERAS